MYEIYIGTNLDRKKYTVDPDTTIRSALEEHDIDYEVGMVTLDSQTLRGADLDKTFRECNAANGSYLLCVKKLQNA